MKRVSAYKILCVLSALLAIVFLALFLVDAFCYRFYIGSAPFYAYLLVDAVWFLLPSAILFGAALLVRRSSRNKKKNGL